jgi:hypothetical protein
MRIELENKRRFWPIEGAKVLPVAKNAWHVRLPRDSEQVQRCRRPWTLEGWDGALICVDGVEAEPAVASDINATHVTLTVYILS